MSGERMQKWEQRSRRKSASETADCASGEWGKSVDCASVNEIKECKWKSGLWEWRSRKNSGLLEQRMIKKSMSEKQIYFEESTLHSSALYYFSIFGAHTHPLTTWKSNPSRGVDIWVLLPSSVNSYSRNEKLRLCLTWSRKENKSSQSCIKHKGKPQFFFQLC